MTYVPRRELPEFVRNVRAVLELLPEKDGAVVVYLNGDLGAGKTTFVQELAKEFGIGETVQSPTYTIMKSYAIPQGTGRTDFGTPRRYKKLVHIDAYRLEKPEEWRQLKPEQFLNERGTMVLLEWPNKVAGVAPEADLALEFSAEEAGDEARDIQMRK